MEQGFKKTARKPWQVLRRMATNVYLVAEDARTVIAFALSLVQSHDAPEGVSFCVCWVKRQAIAP